jgi:PAS domain S-box-containing protein
MPQIVWTATEQGLIEYLNQRWYELTGFAPSDHLAEDIHSILHPDSLTEFVTSWEAAVHAKQLYETEIRFLDRATGQYRWFLCRAIPVGDGDVNRFRWFGTFTDIHEQKRMETALRRANQDLSRFTDSTSHDLQEPLRNISMYSQLLERKYGSHLDSEATNFIQLISRDVRRMRDLIANLAVYTSARSSAGLIRTSCDSNTALKKVLSDLHASIADTRALISFEELPAVRMAEEDLEQLFRQLIQNAVQYRRKGVAPSIGITARRHGFEWRFSVQDNGIGIPAQYTHEIFGVFKRLHGAGEYGSIGMGLPICHKIVEQYGGRIWVESQPDAGSCFHFSLPAVHTVPGSVLHEQPASSSALLDASNDGTNLRRDSYARSGSETRSNQ